MKFLHDIIFDADVNMRSNLKIFKLVMTFAATDFRQNCIIFKHNSDQALMTFHMTFI